MHTPQLHQQEYKVTLHENRGPNEIFVIWIGTFPTLELAQRAAQEALILAVSACAARGYSGIYYNKIDLEHHGLVTGLDDWGQYVVLSEIHIDLREIVMGPKYQPYGTGNVINLRTGYHNTHNTATPLVSADYHLAYDNNNVLQAVDDVPVFAKQQVTSPPAVVIGEIFSQTRLPFLDHPSSWIPRDFYDETMYLSPPDTQRVRVPPEAPQISKARNKKDRCHPRRQSSSRLGQQGVVDEVVSEYIGNALGGGVEIGPVHLGRRHSLADLRAKGSVGEDEEM